MSELFSNLFTNQFMPHGMCYLWLPEILWTHVVADALTLIAYYSIPFSILMLMRKRRDISFPQVGWLFAAFIFLCGTTHAFSIWVVWNGDYGIQGVVKAVTAAVSIATAVVVWRILPTALAVPSQAQLENEVKAATERLVATNRALAQSNEELESFVSIASHDLKEPLRTLVSFSQLLEEDLGDDISEDARIDLQHIVSATRQMRTLVQDLLDLTRTSRAELRMECVEVDACVNEALRVLEAQVKASGAQISRDPLPTIIGDKTLLAHVYQNLISNAIKFTKPNTRPMIRLTAATDSSDHVVLGVKDEGIGISPEWHSKIFEAFERLHGRDQYEGAGVGLAICRRALDRLGGTIWVEATEDAGSHFKFTVQRQPERRVATLASKPALEPAIPSYSSS